MARYKPGQSGNLNGKPKGCINKTTRIRAMFESRKQELIDKAIEMALSGDTAALRLCLERVVSPLRATSAPVRLRMPDEASAADYGHSVLSAIAGGQIAPDVGAQLLSAIGAHVRAVELAEIEKRLEALEQSEENI